MICCYSHVISDYLYYSITTLSQYLPRIIMPWNFQTNLQCNANNAISRSSAILSTVSVDSLVSRQRNLYIVRVPSNICSRRCCWNHNGICVERMHLWFSSSSLKPGELHYMPEVMPKRARERERRDGGCLLCVASSFAVCWAAPVRVLVSLESSRVVRTTAS